MDARFFNLSIPAPKRLSLMREAFATHSARYPHCPPSAVPKSWRDIRGTSHKGFHAYVGGLNQGYNGTDSHKVIIWSCHAGPQFRDERYADEVCGTVRRNSGTGWYTDTYHDETARGIVARLTHGRFIAGYEWSSNGERVYFSDVFSDESDASCAADGHAESFADIAREDNERFNAMQAAEDEKDSAEKVARLAIMTRNVSAEHREIARDALETLREKIEALSEATVAYERV